jgi:hypothetical protein
MTSRSSNELRQLIIFQASKILLTDLSVRYHQLILIPFQFLHSSHFESTLNQLYHLHLSSHHLYQMNLSIFDNHHQVNTLASRNLLLL